MNTRRKCALIFSAVVLVSLILFSITACGNSQGTGSSTLTKPVTTEKTETTPAPIPFPSTTENDPTLAQGQTRIKQAGTDGLKQVQAKVTYVDGKETKREPLPDVVTLQPVSQITSVGTYVVPTTSVPQDGPTAQCNDGTYSYSANHSGTCSHHGGVAEWYR